ncbi:unnamed protein product [Gongylonema pulchrum]|uniref:FGGY_N domain-containing protein n=1 Tax=Gongylonema pulchrum TaxID=637853 RepID=A0A183CWN7_9BILA|nr:unnamed protein product [Gongylonema pulchrum]
MCSEGSVAAAIGIDIGTTSIKCCVLSDQGRILAQKSVVHDAWIKHQGNGYHEQDAAQILHVACSLLKSLDLAFCSYELTISVTGQMHGIVFWNGQDLAEGKFNCSPLITWMDERVPKSFVKSLPRWECGELHIGYGLVTFAWLRTHDLIDPTWTCCGTIMDMLICYLAQLTHSVIGIQNAYSWGYCTYDGHWTVQEELVPAHLRPKICLSDDVVGLVQRTDAGLPLHAKLLASCGDLQSTVYPLLKPGLAVLNLGTSAQLCFAHSYEDDAIIASPPLLIEPFFGTQDTARIVVAASMNGGNAIDTIANKIVEWATELTSGDYELRVDFGKLNELLDTPAEQSSPTVCVDPVFIVERSSSASSSISGISSRTTIKEVIHGTAAGVISNLFRLLSPDQLYQCGIRHIKLTGNAGRSYFINEIKRQCGQRFCIFVTDDTNCSAAYGAALHALQLSRNQ